MRTKERKTKKVRESLFRIMLMLISVFSFSCMVSARKYDSYYGETTSDFDDAKTIHNGDVITGSIDPYQNYDCYALGASIDQYGYYSFKFKALSDYQNDSKIDISIFIQDYDGDYPFWNYSGKVQQSLKANIGCEGSTPLYIFISGPDNMKYRISMQFHEADNWEKEDRYQSATLIDHNKKIHGNSCYDLGRYDFDYYEMDIPSPGVITFEMNRTPKSYHQILIYDGKKTQLWKTKATSDSHVVSKKIKVKSGKIYIRIFGKNTDEYNFKVVHKQTTKTPNKTKITGTERLDKGFQVTWMDPGGKLSGYQIQYAKDSSFKQGVKSKWVTKKNKISIGGLEIGTSYNIRVRSYYKENGKIYYSDWSNNSYVRTLSVSPSETKPAGLKMISCGSSANAFLKKDGSLWVCGYNRDGRLGNGSEENIEKPEKILDNVKYVCLSSYDLFVIKNDNTLWGCGDNSFGELGDGTTKSRTKLVKIMSDVKYIDCLKRTTAIIKNDNSLWTVGDNDLGQLGDGSTTDKRKPVKIMKDVDTVGMGGSHLMILKKDGSLWGCGNNRSGELGDGTNINRLEPVKIMDNVKDVKAGSGHTAILKKDGSLWTCGYNEHGQIGDGTTDDKNYFVKIRTGVKSIDCGRCYTVFTANDDTLWGFGENVDGIFGDGTCTNKLKPIKICTDVKKVSCGSSNLGIIKNDGLLWMGGSNWYSSLGVPNLDTVDSRLNLIPLQLK